MSNARLDEVRISLLPSLPPTRLNRALKFKIACKKLARMGWPLSAIIFLAATGISFIPVLENNRRLTAELDRHKQIRDEIFQLYQKRSLNSSLTCPNAYGSFWNHPEYDIVPPCTGSDCYMKFFHFMMDYCGWETYPFVVELLKVLDEICSAFRNDFCEEYNLIPSLDTERIMLFYFYIAGGLVAATLFTSVISYFTKKCLARSELDQFEQNDLQYHRIAFDRHNPEVTLELIEERKNYLESYVPNEQLREKIEDHLKTLPLDICDIIYAYAYRPPFFSSKCRKAFLNANTGETQFSKPQPQTSLVRFFRACKKDDAEKSRAVIDKIFAFAGI